MVISYCEAMLLGDVGSVMHNFANYMKPGLFKMYDDYRTAYFELVEQQEKKIKGKNL